MVLRIMLAALAGSVGWWLGLNFIFGSLQGVLGDPALQSPKLIAVFSLEPVPRIAGEPWLLYAGMLAAALFQAVVFAAIRSSLPLGLVRRGVAFAAIAWALYVPWFEFYIPWNLFLEPLPLVGLELLCWAGVMLLVGLGISLGFGRDAGASSVATER